MCILLSVCTFGKRVFILVRGQATDRLYAFLLLFYNCNQPTLFCFSLFSFSSSRISLVLSSSTVFFSLATSLCISLFTVFFPFLLFPPLYNKSFSPLLISSIKLHSFSHPTAFFLSSSICNESLSHLLNRTTTRLHHRSVSTFHRQSNLYVGLFEGWLRTTPPQTRFQPPSSLIPSIYESRNAWRRDILSLSFSIRKT